MSDYPNHNANPNANQQPSQYPQPNQYPAPNPYGNAGVPQAPLNTMSIVAIVAAFVFAPLGVVFGIVSLLQIKSSGERGRVLAISAIAFAGFAVLMLILVVIISIATNGVTVEHHVYSDF